MRVGGLGTKLDHPAIGGDRFLAPAGLEKDIPKIVMGIGIVGRECQGAPDERHGLGARVLAMPENAEEMQRVGMVGRVRQHRRIERLGLAQPVGAMERDGLGEQGTDRPGLGTAGLGAAAGGLGRHGSRRARVTRGYSTGPVVSAAILMLAAAAATPAG